MKKGIVPLRKWTVFNTYQKEDDSKRNYMTLLDRQGCVPRPLTECAKPYYYGRTDKDTCTTHFSPLQTPSEKNNHKPRA